LFFTLIPILALLSNYDQVNCLINVGTEGQPLILTSDSEPGMFDFFRLMPWVLEPYVYESQEHLLASLESRIILKTAVRW
jgi:hypothetical protein